MKKGKMGLWAGLPLIVVLAVGGWFYFCRDTAPETTRQPQKVLEFYQQREEALNGFEWALNAYSKDHSTVEIRQKNIPNALEVLIARMQRGDVPDIFTYWPTQLSFQQAVDRGLVKNLAGEAFLDQVEEETLKLVTQPDGGIYALPINRNCMEVYYNADVFNELGLTPPKTLNELFDLCDTLQKSSIVPMVFCVRDGRIAHVAQAVFSVLVEDYLTKMERLGQKIIDAAGANEIRNAARSLLKLYKYSLKQGEDTAYTYYKACQVFASGKAAMFLSGSYAFNTISAQSPKFTIEVFPFPGYTENQKVMITSVDTALCVAADSPFQEDALSFLSFMMQPETAAQYAAEDLGPSCISFVRQENKVTQDMRMHISTYKNVDWLKSRFSLESVTAFEVAVTSFLLTGQEDVFYQAIQDAFTHAGAQKDKVQGMVNKGG